MTTIYAAIGIFGFAALIGMYLIMQILKDKQPNKTVVIIHSILAVLGLALLINYCVWISPRPIASMTLFLIAIIEGSILAYQYLTGNKISKWLAVVYGITAMAGYAFLLCFVFLLR